MWNGFPHLLPRPMYTPLPPARMLSTRGFDAGCCAGFGGAGAAGPRTWPGPAGRSRNAPETGTPAARAAATASQVPREHGPGATTNAERPERESASERRARAAPTEPAGPPADQTTEAPRADAQRARRAPRWPDPGPKAQNTTRRAGATAATARTTAQSAPEAQPTRTSAPASATRAAKEPKAAARAGASARPPPNPTTQDTAHLPPEQQRRARANPSAPPQRTGPRRSTASPKQQTRSLPGATPGATGGRNPATTWLRDLALCFLGAFTLSQSQMRAKNAHRRPNEDLWLARWLAGVAGEDYGPPYVRALASCWEGR